MPLEFSNQGFRRLLVYLIIDRSGSMAGPAIQAVNEGLRFFETTMKADPRCMETVFPGVIAFSSDAIELIAPGELAAFRAPRVDSDGGVTALGSAVRTLRQSIDRTWRGKSAEHPGDYKPLVFLLTDGYFNDPDWRAELKALMDRKGGRPHPIVTIGFGTDCNEQLLAEVSPDLWFYFKDKSESKIKRLFQWITASTKAASLPASQAAAQQAPKNVVAPPPPDLFDSMSLN